MSEVTLFEVVHLPLARLSASPTQPRKNFPAPYLEGLAASIREQGVRNPIHVRSLPGLFGQDESAQLFEIISGECRVRGSRLADCTHIPCFVCDWTDRQVVEWQLIENLQRKDLDPLEESESYHATLELRSEFGAKVYTVETLAQKLGWQPSYIYQRLSFRDLPPAGRRALMDGVFGVAMARLIARIPSETAREEAASRIIKPDFQDAPLTTRQAEDMVRRHYMRELRRAPFDQNDATLVPHMGACTTCKFRTGNNPTLYGDVQRGDVCTFPDCYRQKVEAIWGRATGEAKAAGKIILTADQSEHLWNDEGKLEWNSDWVRLGDQPSSDLVVSTTQRLPAWKSLLDKAPAKVQVYVARTPRGAIHELAYRKDALTAARLGRPEMFITPRGQAAPAPLPMVAVPPPPAPAAAAASQKPVPSTQQELPVSQTNADAEADRQRAERLKTRVDLAVLKETVAELVKGIEAEGAEPSPDYWRNLVVLAVAHAGKEGWGFLADRRGLDVAIFKEAPADAASILWGDLSVFQLPALIVELLLGPYIRFQGGESNALLAPLLTDYGVDAAGIRREVEAKHQPKKDKNEKTKV